MKSILNKILENFTKKSKIFFKNIYRCIKPYIVFLFIKIKKWIILFQQYFLGIGVVQLLYIRMLYKLYIVSGDEPVLKLYDHHFHKFLSTTFYNSYAIEFNGMSYNVLNFGGVEFFYLTIYSYILMSFYSYFVIKIKKNIFMSILSLIPFVVHCGIWYIGDLYCILDAQVLNTDTWIVLCVFVYCLRRQQKFIGSLIKEKYVWKSQSLLIFILGISLIVLLCILFPIINSLFYEQQDYVVKIMYKIWKKWW